ncbi:MAG: retropepsin-like aspartic protease [Terracidiphilus sp.]
MNSRPYLFLCILACVSVACQAPAAGFNHPQPTPAIEDTANATVRFELYQDYLIVAHGSAGPLKGLNFFVDTGTSLPILDSRIARKLHLQNQASASIVILGGRAPGEEAMLPSLGFGPVELSNLQVVTADLSFFRKILPVRIDAIVGLDVLGEKAFVIDYSARVIRFGALPALPVSIPLRLDRGLASFDAEIDHAPVHLVFDTGTASLVLFVTAAQSGSSAKVDAIQEPDNIGDFARKAVRLGTVRLGDEEFHQRPAILVRNPKQSQLDFDGLMSPAALGISRVSVDLKGGVLAFSR